MRGARALTPVSVTLLLKLKSRLVRAVRRARALGPAPAYDGEGSPQTRPRRGLAARSDRGSPIG
eukprot:1952389-Pyramimonas_sp.AAC.1